MQLTAALHDMRLVLLLVAHYSGHGGVLMHISQTHALCGYLHLPAAHDSLCCCSMLVPQGMTAC